MEKYTTEILVEVENMASLQFSPDEVALAMRIDRQVFRKALKEPGNDLADAYQRGRIKSEAEVRAAIYKLAKQGSTPAQKQMMDFAQANKRELDKIKK